MLYLIDLFCGAGGVTTGASLAENVQVIACVNHDPLAIKSHEANHPNCKHYIEDIRTLDLTELVAMVNAIRRTDANAIIGLWASLECTNFSKAKGGLPRDADSRTLAEHLIASPDKNGVAQPRYIPLLNPDIVFIENVEEFMSWGPLDDNGKPMSRKAGCDYQNWVDTVCSLNYQYEYKILNAADYGAYTSRKRFFAQFTLQHINIAWPIPTHAKKPFNDAFGSLKKWKPVKEVLSLEKHGESIFGRKKNLSDKTYERIYHGLIKFVAGGKNAFMLKYNSINGKTGVHHPPSVDEPCPTVSTQGRLGLVNAQFISKYFSGKPEYKSSSLEAPAATVKTIDNQALVTGHFLTTYHGNGSNVHSLDGAAPTIPTKDSAALVQPFIMRDFSGGGQSASIDAPAGSVMPSPKMNLVSPEYFL
jgi:DNA (cytosine-5)-methyltransferase 1